MISFPLIALTFYLTLKFEVSSSFYTKLTAISTAFAAVGGIALLVVTYLIFYDTKQQREMEKDPIITLHLIPDNKNSNFVNFSIKNTGGEPAYQRAFFVQDPEDPSNRNAPINIQRDGNIMTSICSNINVIGFVPLIWSNQ